KKNERRAAALSERPCRQNSSRWRAWWPSETHITRASSSSATKQKGHCAAQASPGGSACAWLEQQMRAQTRHDRGQQAVRSLETAEAHCIEEDAKLTKMALRFRTKVFGEAANTLPVTMYTKRYLRDPRTAESRAIWLSSCVSGGEWRPIVVLAALAAQRDEDFPVSEADEAEGQHAQATIRGAQWSASVVLAALAVKRDEGLPVSEAEEAEGQRAQATLDRFGELGMRKEPQGNANRLIRESAEQQKPIWGRSKVDRKDAWLANMKPEREAGGEEEGQRGEEEDQRG
ncbi:hypothetical protein B484DRAFT_468032, partial [Ochromonadaceae sp. CCMP2298]